MADIIRSVFRNKKANPSKLVAFGFERTGADYAFQSVLSDSGFEMTVNVTAEGEITSEVIDPAFNAPYALHLVEGAMGGFVGGVRKQHAEQLLEIAEKCFEPDAFKAPQAKAVIAYVKERYGNDLEFLWPKASDNAIWRREDTGKWYGALLKVSKRKLGIKSDEAAEIIDLRIRPDEVQALVDNERCFPGYHMNKKSWYTIILDGSVPHEDICRGIDRSYLLATK